MNIYKYAVFFLTIFSFSIIYAEENNLVDKQCNRIGNKLGSVSVEDCLAVGLTLTDGITFEGAPILIKEYPPLETREPLGKVLLIGGIHGDEYSSVSIIFKWLKTLDNHKSGLFHCHGIPLVNVDG